MGIWTAIFSVVHVISAALIHVSHGTGLFSSFVHFFMAEDGSALTNSFGLGNWAGLVAVVIVLGLLAISTDAAMRKLKAGPWKWLQRLSYVLFALVILHAFFYGALLRPTSPFTLLLVLSVMVVFIGQAVGVWLSRRRYSRTAATARLVALLSLGVLIPSTVNAQGYDAKSEATFEGTVADVKGGRSALYWFSRIHTLGMGHMRVPDTQLLLKTDTETLEIQLGPSAFLTDQKVDISEGDTLEVIGSRVPIGDSQVVLAREMRKGNETWKLRDATGQPLWDSGATEARGFWTTKKVLVVVVAAKVVLLATVLRH